MHVTLRIILELAFVFYISFIIISAAVDTVKWGKKSMDLK